MDWDRVINEVAFAGCSGITLDDLIARLTSIDDGWKFDECTRKLFWNRLLSFAEIERIVHRNLVSHVNILCVRMTIR